MNWILHRSRNFRKIYRPRAFRAYNNMATKQEEVAKEFVKQISRVDSGVASSGLSLESCAESLQGLSKEVLLLQHRYE